MCVCVCVCVCVCACSSVFTPWAVWWGLECDGRQDKKELETSSSPCVQERRKRSLNIPRTLCTQRRLSRRLCTWGLAPAGGSTWEPPSDADPHANTVPRGPTDTFKYGKCWSQLQTNSWESVTSQEGSLEEASSNENCCHSGRNEIFCLYQ